MSPGLDIPDRDDPRSDDPVAPRPVVVVQYRRGWAARLTTPLLLLITAGAILSHRVKIDDWRGLTSYLPSRASLPSPAPPSAVEPAPPTAPPSAAEAKPPSPALPSPPVEIRTVAAPPPEPPRPEARPPLTLMPRPLAIALPDTHVPAGKIWEDIHREIARTKKAVAAMEGVKARHFEDDQKIAAIEKAEAVRRKQFEVVDQRVAFHDALRRALTLPARKPGQSIRDLCDRFQTPLDAEWRKMGRTLPATPGLTSMGRRDRIERLRNQGLVEAAILADLVRLEKRNRVARGGPRTEEDVLIRAAKQLLAVPVIAPQ